MTTIQTFAAGIALIRDLFILAVFFIAGAPIINMVAQIMGQQIPTTAQGQLWFGMIQPSYMLFYIVVIIAGLMRIVWFLMTAIQRVDYAEAM
jgi:hypothetical protein